MNSKSKFFNILSTISVITMILLIYMFIVITDSYYLNGYLVLLFLCLLFNPIKNLFRIKKKIINNSFYHLLVMCFSGYTTYISTKSIQLYYKNLSNPLDNAISHNLAVNYFGDYFLLIIGLAITLLILECLFKKVIIKQEKNRSKRMLFIILLTSIIPFITGSIWQMNLICAGFNVAGIIFTLLIFFKQRNVVTTSDMQGYCFILIITSIMSINPIAIFLSIIMYAQLTSFSLNI